jgi:hypothetical protein
MNIEDSDGTLIICRGGLAGGTALTRALALRRGKPLLVVDVALFERKEAAQAIRAFIRENGISILNVAGPRESQCPGIYRAATVILTEAGQRGINQDSCSPGRVFNNHLLFIKLP